MAPSRGRGGASLGPLLVRGLLQGLLVLFLLSCGLPWARAEGGSRGDWREEAIRRASSSVVSTDDFDTGDHTAGGSSSSRHVDLLSQPNFIAPSSSVGLAVSVAVPASGPPPLLHVLPPLQGTIPSTGRPYVAHVSKSVLGQPVV